MKFNDRTSIPLIWVLSAYVPTTLFVVTTALWVFNVNTRLARIESRLGIQTPSPGSLFQNAEAGTK